MNMIPSSQKTPYLLALILTLLCAVQSQASDVLYQEQYRPQFHFTPDKGWMNDPNGLVYLNGEYHLFFQCRPDSLVQTPVISWGHAVSSDLIHWNQLPIALHPDDHDGWIWSGSAVVDRSNTSGFGAKGRPPLVAIYTAAKTPFAQAIAYSNDRGRTWTKYAGNPVVPHIANTNRDPHVIWHQPTRQWVMILFKDVADTFCLLTSPDLKNWTHQQDLQIPGCGECPDIFPMNLDADPSKPRWIITVANGKYLVGDFDGRHFTATQELRQVDFGRNYYAVQTFNDIPPEDGRRIQIAWMAGGVYPDMPFNQQMSFPAELTLRTTSDGPRLFRNPVREINRLHSSRQRWDDIILNDHKNLRAHLTGDLAEIHADIQLGDAAETTILLRGEPITYNAAAKTLTALGEAPLTLPDKNLRLQILLDRTSLETFADGGRVSLTSCFLPRADEQEIVVSAKGGAAHLKSLVVYDLHSAWPSSSRP